MIPLEHVQPEDWPAVNRVVDQLRALVLDTGGLSIGLRVGTSALAWAASTDAGPKTVTHGLGRTPKLVAVFNADTTGSYPGIAAFTTLAVGATTFDFYGRTPGAITGTKAVYWLVIG